MLPKLYQAGFSIFYGEDTILIRVVFAIGLEVEQQIRQGCRYKVFSAHPLAFGGVYYPTLRLEVK